MRRGEEIAGAPLLIRPSPSHRVLTGEIHASTASESMNAIFQSSSSWPVRIGAKKLLTFGDFVAGVYHAWGKRKAIGVVQLAVKAHIVEFRGVERFRIS